MPCIPINRTGFLVTILAHLFMDNGKVIEKVNHGGIGGTARENRNLFLLLKIKGKDSRFAKRKNKNKAEKQVL